MTNPIRLENVTLSTIPFEPHGFEIGVMQGTYQGDSDWVQILPKVRLTEAITNALAGDAMAILHLAEWCESGAAFSEELDESAVTMLPVSPQTAFRLLKSAADSANGALLFKLGCFLERGIGTQKDYSAALQMFAKAADLGHLLAQYNLATLQLTGSDAAERARGLKSLEHLAETGLPEAQLAMGACYFPGLGPDWIKPDLNKALHYIDQAGSEGAPETQFSMALGFHSGAPGVPQDPERAWRLCFASAEQDYPPAQQVAGILLLKSDPEQAVEWFERAAQAGIVDAQINLALFYSQGEICDFDPEGAYFWASVAAKQDPDGRRLADQLAVNLSLDALARVNASVHHWEVAHLPGPQ